MKFFLFLFLPLLFLFSTGAMAQDFTKFEKKEYEEDGKILPYRILLPKNFQSGNRYPLVLFLHGSGERGSDNEAQLTHGGKLFLQDEVREKYPAIVVFPQCSANSSWAKLDVKGNFPNREFILYEDAEPTNDMVLLEGLLKQRKIDKSDYFSQLVAVGSDLVGAVTVQGRIE